MGYLVFNNFSGRMRVRRASGFTLIELVIVIVIIGVLAAIAIPMFIHMQNNAREARVKNYAHTVQLAAEVYAVSNFGTYSDMEADILPLLPKAGPLENSFTGALVEPQFGAPALTAGQIGLQVVIEDGVNVGYRITGFGKDNLILVLTSGQ